MQQEIFLHVILVRIIVPLEDILSSPPLIGLIFASRLILQTIIFWFFQADLISRMTNFRKFSADYNYLLQSIK